MRISPILVAIAVLGASMSAAQANNIVAVASPGSIPVETDPNNSANDTIYSLTTPGNYSYTNSYTVGGTFYDDYYFYISPSQIDSITASVSTPFGGSSIGVSSPQARLFSWAPNQALAFPTTGAITANGGQGALINPWASDTVQTINGSQFYISNFSDSNLATGYYVLQITGTVDPQGGSYTGSLNLSPVPIPAALPLFMVGLGLLGAAARRARSRD